MRSAITLSIPAALQRRLDSVAKARRMTRSAFYVKMLAASLSIEERGLPELTAEEKRILASVS